MINEKLISNSQEKKLDCQIVGVKNQLLERRLLDPRLVTFARELRTPHEKMVKKVLQKRLRMAK